MGIYASIPSYGAAHIGEQDGDIGKYSTGGTKCESKHAEEEPVDYEPSPVKEKDKEKTPPKDDDVYSLSKLIPPCLDHQKV